MPPPQTSSAASRGITGTITTGGSTKAASQQISPSGGTIKITDSGSPINGLELKVPSGAYTTSLNFSISSALVEKHTFGEDFNPISPLITIDNGGGYSQELMQVKVPVTVPADHFAMGFYYDSSKQKLTGMNLLASDASSITVGARHFSDFIISMIPLVKLKKDIDSGFRPGIDDWQFVNRGSYIEPGGHCAGQSLTALWYYVNQPDGKGLTLYNRYDNNGQAPQTPNFWQDDSRAYRLASTVQHDINWSSFENLFLANLAGVNDEATWNLFAYSMQLTGEPQEVGIFSNAGGGHDMICYRIENGNLYIADPNYPGDTGRRIEYSNGRFTPYNSGADADAIAAGHGQNYEKIEYCAKTTTINWNTIAQRWAEFKAGTIGNDKFPEYKINYVDTNGQEKELQNEYVCPEKSIDINISSSNPDVAFAVYRGGSRLNKNAEGKYDLNQGNNQLGIYVLGEKNGNWEYVDFKYYNIVYKKSSLTIDPTYLEGKIGEEYTFTAKSDSTATGAIFEWVVNGAVKQKSTSATFRTEFTSAGIYTIQVTMSLGNTVILSPGATAKIVDAVQTPSPSPSVTPTPLSNLEKLQALSYVKGNFSSTFNIEHANYATASVSKEISGAGIPTFESGDDIGAINITWKGTSFSGEVTSDTAHHMLNGQVSADGSLITNLNYQYSYSKSTTSYGTTTRVEKQMVIKLRNIPVEASAISQSGFSFIRSGAETQNYVAEFSLHRITYQNGKMNTEDTIIETIWTETGSNSKPKLTLNFTPNR